MTAEVLCSHGQHADQCTCAHHEQRRHCQRCNVGWNYKVRGFLCWNCASDEHVRIGDTPKPAPPRREEPDE